MSTAQQCCPILTKIGMCQQILVKLPNTKFHKNPVILRQSDLNMSSAGILMCLEKWEREKTEDITLL
jgi:hypothetical protein